MTRISQQERRGVLEFEIKYWEVTKMRGYEAAKILKEKGITIDDVNA